MDVKVFVSSTKDDLDRECRPQVILSIRSAQALPIAMEDWPAEYAPALDEVKRKIEESTHYLGLFAYRRGWTPPDNPVSITEAEFDHACATLRGRIAVFVPAEGSPIAAVLMGYATAAQDEADTEAQVHFLKRVMGAGMVESFRDVGDLATRTTRCVIFWNRPLLEMQLQRSRGAPGVPGPDDVAALGRTAQADCFEVDVLPRLAATGGATQAAGVLIHGPAGHGQAELLGRLERRFEAVSRRTHPLTVRCGALWRSGGLGSLLRVLARETGVAELATVAAAGAHLGTLLAQKDVVLRVTALQNYEGGVPGFVEQFWAPLVAALPAGTPYRLLCLATHEGTTPAAPAWEAAAQPCGSAPWDARRLLRLAELAPFTAAELSLFVRPRVEPAQVDDLVTALMDATDGVPNLLYAELTDPANWPN